MADAVDPLYDLAPSEFTAARDALVKELRAAGDKDRAAEVKALRRPSVAAWAINRAARERREELEDLLGAAAALRRAHERLLAGKGDRSVLREASEHERAAVGAFARAVEQVAEDAGQPLAPPALTKVRETLHAATLDDAVREQLEAGRLEREADAIGAEGLLATAAAPAGRGGRGQGKGERGGAAKRRTEEDARSGAADARGGAAGARRATAAERRAAKERRAAAIRDLRAADRAASRAEREAETARRRTERAEEAASAARERLEAAERDLEEARSAEDDARRAVRQAKEALAAAQARVDDAGDE